MIVSSHFTFFLCPFFVNLSGILHKEPQSQQTISMINNTMTIEAPPKVSFYASTFFIETLLHYCLLMLLCIWPPESLFPVLTFNYELNRGTILFHLRK